MSRSRRKTPKMGCASSSEKRCKQRWHRCMRAHVRVALNQHDLENVLLPEIREVSNPWEMAKDGKGWFDPREYPKLMRK